MDHLVYVSSAKEGQAAAVQVCALLEERGVRCWTPWRDRPPKPGRILLHELSVQHARVMLVLDWPSRTSERLLGGELPVALANSVEVIETTAEEALADPGRLLEAIHAAVARVRVIRVFCYSPAAAADPALVERALRAAEAARQGRVRLELHAWGATAERPALGDILITALWRHAAHALHDWHRADDGRFLWARTERPGQAWLVSSLRERPGFAALTGLERARQLDDDRFEFRRFEREWLEPDAPWGSTTSASSALRAGEAQLTGVLGDCIAELLQRSGQQR